MEKENNILNNLPPFYIGEVVEAIEEYNWYGWNPIKKGNKYIVNDCFKCKCNTWMVFISGVQYHACTECSNCGYRNGKIYFEANMFRSLQQKSYPLMTFKEIVKKEEKEVLILN
jgi:hypothetical protein